MPPVTMRPVRLPTIPLPIPLAPTLLLLLPTASRRARAAVVPVIYGVPALLQLVVAALGPVDPAAAATPHRGHHASPGHHGSDRTRHHAAHHSSRRGDGHRHGGAD